MAATSLQSHLSKWQNCTACELHKQRNQTVHARGTIPCQVAFIGEAPGDSEDVLGYPFAGPAGELLDYIVGEAITEFITRTEGNKTKPTMAFFNLVACFPREAKKTNNHQPPVDSIKRCMPRVTELVDLCEPMLVVFVGTLAEKWAPKAMESMNYDPFVPIQTVRIRHPSFILQTDPSQQGIHIQDSIIALAEAMENIL